MPFWQGTLFGPTGYTPKEDVAHQTVHVPHHPRYSAHLMSPGSQYNALPRLPASSAGTWQDSERHTKMGTSSSMCTSVHEQTLRASNTSGIHMPRTLSGCPDTCRDTFSPQPLWRLSICTARSLNAATRRVQALCLHLDVNCRNRRLLAAQKNTSNSCRLYVLMPSSSSLG